MEFGVKLAEMVEKEDAKDLDWLPRDCELSCKRGKVCNNFEMIIIIFHYGAGPGCFSPRLRLKKPLQPTACVFVG
jgi:hypothetical protein